VMILLIVVRYSEGLLLRRRCNIPTNANPSTVAHICTVDLVPVPLLSWWIACLSKPNYLLVVNLSGLMFSIRAVFKGHYQVQPPDVKNFWSYCDNSVCNTSKLFLCFSVFRHPSMPFLFKLHALNLVSWF